MWHFIYKFLNRHQGMEKSATKRAKNPYVYGNTVGKTPVFVGRGEILEQVTSVLEQDENNAIVLRGRARIGKSSILERLEQQLSQRESYVPFFFDCSPYQDNISKENFLRNKNSEGK